MLTGVGGFVLGLIFVALGLFLYMRKKVSGWEGGRGAARASGCLLCAGRGLRFCPCPDADLVSRCFRAPRSPGCR